MPRIAVLPAQFVLVYDIDKNMFIKKRRYEYEKKKERNKIADEKTHF